MKHKTRTKATNLNNDDDDDDDDCGQKSFRTCLVLAKRLSGKNVSEITYFVSTGT